ncbi:MAG: ABC transporter ATP-binding protein [Fimbriimonadaceae bacterium]|nr:ABC transporter ATP-binding protein [Alphaproteobacteria bacterium]
MMLELRDLHSFYGVSQALFGMNLKIESGEVVTLIGRNGMGKTTTVHSIMGIVRPRKGQILFDGIDIAGLPSFRVAKAGLALVPEGRQVFPNLTVLENLVATAANRSNRSDPWTIERVFELFPELAGRRGQMGNLLSGGEQQMLAIGRALMTNPELLILDEATEGLAPLVRREIWACLTRLKDERQSILVIDKNIADLCRIADRHYIIEKGAVVWQGSSAGLMAQPDLHARYLGV